MGGDGHALALRAGAELIDMEFVQFFPIGHLAPRLVGMDPIMWDPFRYKLGGQLLNGEGHEFIGDYDAAEQGHYRATRDVATYAILKEIEAGRGSPSGGVYLSFRHLPEARLRDAFGPVIDRLLANRIDLTRDCGRGFADRPLPHGRNSGGWDDAKLRTRTVCGRRSRWVAPMAQTGFPAMPFRRRSSLVGKLAFRPRQCGENRRARFLASAAAGAGSNR